MKTVKVLKDQSGAALVIALLMMIAMTLIAVASTSTSIFEIKLAGNKRSSTDAFYAADSGIQVVMANVENFNLTGKYVDNKYDPFTDPNNPNPTRAEVTTYYDTTQEGAPRGLGLSATGNFEFRHFLIESTGYDQTESNPIKSKCTVEEKVVRLIPTTQGGY